MVQTARSRKHCLAFVMMLLACSETNAFAPSADRSLMNQHKRRSPAPLHMQPKNTKENKKKSSISAFEATGRFSEYPSSGKEIPKPSMLEEFVLPVACTSMLVTSNTVGAGMLVLPELVAKPGMAAGMELFAVMYLVNLVSGLVLAEVAIQQRQSSGQDSPSSFKEFAEANIDSPIAKDVIASISVVKNALVLAFGTVKAGLIGQEILGLDADVASCVWALAFAGLVGTQSAKNLSQVASVLVFGLFASFAAILVPSLQSVQDPMAVMSLPGTSSDFWGSMWEISPIILMSFIFQNIVPTAARILDYDRTKITVALCLGTLFPCFMYAAWCLAVLGGGVDTTLGGPLFTMFSIVTIAGSHLGSSTSMAEELDTYLSESSSKKVFSAPAVAITAALAISLGEGFSSHLNDLLSLAGLYGSPLLYFVLPVAMAYNQFSQKQQDFLPNMNGNKLLSSATIPLAITAATGFVGTEVLHLL